jgi:hypothetical protein
VLGLGPGALLGREVALALVLASTRAVTSAWMPTKCVSRPSPSYTGDSDSSFQKAVPSLR